MKKIISIIAIILLLGALLFVLTGCGAKEDTDTPDTTGTTNNGETINNNDNNDNNDNNEQGAAKFFNMFKSDNYHMKAKMVVEGQEMTMETYAKDGKALMIMESATGSSRMLVRDDKLYIIDDVEKTMTVMAGTQSTRRKSNRN